MSYVFSMLSKAVSTWKGKGHEPGISDPQVRPRTGRITTVFTKLSTSPLQRAYKQELWRLFEQSWELVLLRTLVLPISSLSLSGEPRRNRLSQSHPSGLKIFIKSCCASSLKTYTSGTKPPDRLHPDHESNSTLVASLRSLSEATH